MAFSTQRAVSDGTLQLLMIEIEFFDRSEITAYFDNIPTTAFTWATDTSLHFNDPVPLGVEVLLRRTTDLSAPRHIFTLGAQFKDSTLDEDFKQILHIAQEAVEGANVGDIYQTLNMHGNLIANVAAGTNPGDAVPYSQLVSYSASVLTTANGYAVAAGVSATEAAQSAIAAAESAADAEAWAASVNLPSITGNAGKYLRANAAGTAIEYGNILDALTDPWLFKPIGEPFPLATNLTGVIQPPTNNANYRYIKLTAADAYNTGVLISESVTGVDPLVQATAVISLVGSPITGQTVRLINTERRMLRAGSAGTVEGDQIQNITGAIAAGSIGIQGPNSSGVFADQSMTGLSFRTALEAAPAAKGYNFDASRVVRTGTETRSKNIGVTYYMRIK